MYLVLEEVEQDGEAIFEYNNSLCIAEKTETEVGGEDGVIIVDRDLTDTRI